MEATLGTLFASRILHSRPPLSRIRVFRLNPQLALLQPYPFERLRALFSSVAPNPQLAPISLSIGEPKHATPALVLDALAAGAKGLANYPTTAGVPALREAIAAWLVRRHALSALDASTQVLPVLGSREALFSFAQTIIDASRVGATVVVPNPFYQIYEGAALLAGATPYYVNRDAENRYAPQWESVPDEVWARTQLLYVCSPDNPTGRVMPQEEWRALFALSDRHGFVIASDECYSEIFFDEANPPIGALGAAQALGRHGYPRLLCFGSLSKRSNAPGLRSGYVAGDAALIRAFLLYRTYHGSAMSPAVAAASIAAWKDEDHARQSVALRTEVLRARASDECRPRRATTRRGVLSVGEGTGRRRRVRAAALRAGSGQRSPGELYQPRGARTQPGTRVHPHSLGGRFRGMRRGHRQAYPVRRGGGKLASAPSTPARSALSARTPSRRAIGRAHPAWLQFSHVDNRARHALVESARRRVPRCFVANPGADPCDQHRVRGALVHR